MRDKSEKRVFHHGRLGETYLRRENCVLPTGNRGMANLTKWVMI